MNDIKSAWAAVTPDMLKGPQNFKNKKPEYRDSTERSLDDLLDKIIAEKTKGSGVIHLVT